MPQPRKMRALCFVWQATSWGLATAVVFCGLSIAQAEPRVGSCVPSSAAPGKVTELVVTGTELSPPLTAWTSTGGAVEVIPTLAADGKPTGTAATIKFTLPADAPAGVAGLMLCSSTGVGDFWQFVVDDLPTVADNNTNHSLAVAQEVTLPVAIGGACEGTVPDYYRFAAKAGEAVSMEVVASRLGVDLDPIIRLLDAAGNELAMADDDASLGADCRLRYKFVADGNYLVELRDSRYKPGGRYHLRLGNFPLVNSPFPPAVASGATALLTAKGPAVEGRAPLVWKNPPLPSRVYPLGFATITRQSWNARFLSGNGAGIGQVVSTPFADMPETAAKEGTLVSIPGSLSGCLEAAGEIDSWLLPAEKGLRVTCRAQARAFGSPARIALRLLNAAGGQVAESTVTGAEDESLTAVIPETGVYKLLVEDATLRGGPEFAYRVEIATGDYFTLQSKNDKATRLLWSTPSNGGLLPLDIQVTRVGYTGPIKLSLVTDRPGWQLIGDVIPEGGVEHKLWVMPPADLAAAEFVPLRLEGTSVTPQPSGKPLKADVTTAAVIRNKGSLVYTQPTWLDGVVAVAGLGEKPALFKIAPPKKETAFVRQIGQATLSFSMERLDAAFKDQPVKFFVTGLPPGVAIEEKRLGTGPTETYELILKGPKDLAEKAWPLKIVAYGEVGGNWRAVPVEEAIITVVEPLAVTLSLAEPLVIGQAKKAKLVLLRKGDDRQPVKIALKNLPAGVTAPAEVEIAADQNEAEIELTVAADAVAGMFENVLAAATGKYAGQDIVAQSAPIKVEVKAP